MKYNIGDRVKLNQDYTLQNGTIPKGTKGTVTKVNNITVTYNVDFGSGQTDIIVPESYLDNA